MNFVNISDIKKNNAICLNIDESPGVYKMLDKNGIILYIGKAKNLKKRITNYFKSNFHGNHIKTMFSLVDRIEYIITNSEYDALLLEENLIHKIKPKYNFLLKDDKSNFYYLTISDEKWPAIGVSRSITAGLVYGPFYSTASINLIFNLGQQVFKIRSCSIATFNNATKLKKICTLGEIGLCLSPCVIKAESYNNNLKKYKCLIQGKTGKTISMLNKEIKKFTKDQNYEAANKIKDQLYLLKKIDFSNIKEIKTILPIFKKN